MCSLCGKTFVYVNFTLQTVTSQQHLGTLHCTTQLSKFIQYGVLYSVIMSHCRAPLPTSNKPTAKCTCEDSGVSKKKYLRDARIKMPTKEKLRQGRLADSPRKRTTEKLGLKKYQTPKLQLIQFLKCVSR